MFKKEWKKWIIFISLLLVFILILFLNIFNNKEKNNLNVEQTENISEISQDKKYKVEKLEKIDNSKDYVYTDEVISENDIEGQGIKISIDKPKLNLTGEYAIEINNKIEKIISNFNNTERYDGMFYDLYYEYYHENNILSVSIFERTGTMDSGDVVENYYFYNINLDNGQNIDMNALCEDFDKEDIDFAIRDDKIKDKDDCLNTDKIVSYSLDSLGQLRIITKEFDEDFGEEYFRSSIVKRKNTYTSGELNTMRMQRVFWDEINLPPVGQKIHIISDTISFKQQENGLYYCSIGGCCDTVVDEKIYNQFKEYAWDDGNEINVTYEVTGVYNGFDGFLLSQLEQPKTIEDFYARKVDEAVAREYFLSDIKIEKICPDNTTDYDSTDYINYTLSEDANAISEFIYLKQQNPLIDIGMITIIEDNFKVEKGNFQDYVIFTDDKGKEYKFGVGDSISNYKHSFSNTNIDSNNIYNGKVSFDVNITSLRDESNHACVKNIKEMERKNYDAYGLYDLDEESAIIKKYKKEHVSIFVEESNGYEYGKLLLINPYIEKIDNTSYKLSANVCYDSNLREKKFEIRDYIFTQEDYKTIKNYIIEEDKKVINGMLIVRYHPNSKSDNNLVLMKFKGFEK